MKARPTDLPACCNCIHFVAEDSTCWHDKCSTFSTTWGRKAVDARHARQDAGECGLKGRFFEPKPVETFLERWGHRIFGMCVVIAFVLFIYMM